MTNKQALLLHLALMSSIMSSKSLGTSQERRCLGPMGLPLLLGFILRTVSGQPAKHPVCSCAPSAPLVVSYRAIVYSILGVVISHLPWGEFHCAAARYIRDFLNLNKQQLVYLLINECVSFQSPGPCPAHKLYCRE